MTVRTVVAIGYPAGDAGPATDRKPLAEIVHRDRFGQTADR